jgi:ribonuclease HI
MESDIGHNTNNTAEIWGLFCGLQAAIKKEIFTIIAEGDSQFVINLLSHLLNGEDPEKISPSWRLMNGLLKIKSTLQPQWVILPSHIRRTTNQVVDLLENFGVELEEGVFSCSPSTNPSHPTVIACRNITHTKYRPPDGVLPSQWHDHTTRRPPS